jgi:hypothetical protein
MNMAGVGIPWQLTQWKIFEVTLPGRPDRTRHFAGYSVALRVPKITGPIGHFDPTKKLGVDETGNEFALVGLSRVSTEVEPAWQAWVAVHGAQAVRDISREIAKLLILHPDSVPIDWTEKAFG